MEITENVILAYLILWGHIALCTRTVKKTITDYYRGYT